ncbi:MAG: Cys-Gln thioester bond-forming surface protein [Clostridia bacterium]|nr:Cys-Gln thioester bond-forming surface protein [Clostridia bacterium]
MKVLRKLMVMMFFVFLLSAAIGAKNSEATSVGDKRYLQRADKGFYSIQKWNGSEWIYVTYSITNYVDENGVSRIAYCVNPDLKGIGYIAGEFEGYSVEIKELIQDQRAWRVITNGYPYKSPEQIGVETDQDAYLATKMALYAMLRNQTSNDIRSLYRAGEDRVAGQSLEDISRRGNKVIEAICKLVDIGNNGSETMQNNDLIHIEKVGEFKQDSKRQDFLSQVIKVSSKVECDSYCVKNLNDFPKGTIITNVEGNEQNEFKGGDEFKILVPKTALIGNINGVVSVEAVCKNYPVYYAECTEGNYQNYILCCDSYTKGITAEEKINVEIDKSKLKIRKIDSEKNVPIKGVKFSVKYKDGKDIGTYVTNEKGEIYLKNLHQGEVVIKEIETSKEYILDSAEKIVNLKYGETKEVVIGNELKKGAINIIKVDAENNEIKIEGAKFEIYDDSNALISTVVTDKDGKAQIDKLPINKKYTIKEVEAANGYILSDDVVTIELKENEIKNITFKNKKKKIDKLPRTGQIDASKYLIGLSVLAIMSSKNILLKKE